MRYCSTAEFTAHCGTLTGTSSRKPIPASHQRSHQSTGARSTTIINHRKLKWQKTELSIMYFDPRMACGVCNTHPMGVVLPNDNKGRKGLALHVAMSQLPWARTQVATVKSMVVWFHNHPIVLHRGSLTAVFQQQNYSWPFQYWNSAVMCVFQIVQETSRVWVWQGKYIGCSYSLWLFALQNLNSEAAASRSSHTIW